MEILTRQTIAVVPGLDLEEFRTSFSADHDPREGKAWTPTWVAGRDAVTLIRSGGYWREATGQRLYLDASGGYLSPTGVESRFAGDDPCVTTNIYFTTDTHRGILERLGQRRKGWRIRTSQSFDLRHRALVAAAKQRTDEFELSERLAFLLDRLCPVDGASAPSPAHQRLVDRTVEALTVGHLTCGLTDLARAVGSSPHHLSRVFRGTTGRTLTDYRNELRVRAVLECVSDGAENLADLAAEYGFADHAHLSRTVRRYTGMPPSAFRSGSTTLR